MTPDAPASPSRNRGSKLGLRLTLLAALLVLGGGGTWIWRSTRQAPAQSTADRMAVVKRQDLVLKIAEFGTIQAVSNNTLRVEVQRQVKILKLTPEGTMVKKGDVVAEMDRSEIELQIQQFTLEHQAATQAVPVAEGALRVQTVVNNDNLQNARAAVAKAQSDLAKYLELEGPKSSKDMAIKVANAKVQVEDARKQRAALVEKQEAELFVEEDQEEQARKALENANRAVATNQTSLEVAFLDQKIFKFYGYPAELANRRALVAKAQIGLEQAEVAAGASLVEKQTQLAAKQNELRQKTANLKRMKDDLEKMIMKAPCDGLVTYGDPTQNWGQSWSTLIKVGAQVNQSWPIVTIPDTTGYLVTLRVGEEYRSRLEKGQDVVATFEAVSGVVLHGKVEEIGNLPTPIIEWDAGSPKVYAVKAKLNENNGRLSPGMSAKVEITTGRLTGALTVPIEAVRYEDGKPYCLLFQEGKGPSPKRELTLGPGTETEVSVTAGLSEGERVRLGTPGQETGP